MRISDWSSDVCSSDLGGWNGVPFEPEHGGQGLPWLVATALNEMWSSANLSFSLCPLLTQGAIDLLTAHGSAEQKATSLARMVSGEWTGTLNLTEPQAGPHVVPVRQRPARAVDRTRPDTGRGGNDVGRQCE